MKPSLPQGTRDFEAKILRKRYFIIETIKHYFELYGFEPLETPAIENLDTLMGKYGDEGDKLIFKILNNGLDNPNKRETVVRAFDSILNGKDSADITSRALKYDLTIPFARYVATNHHEMALPYKRYQIQPVWRADRPQRGRYREFYQCDADVAGTHSLLADTEFAMLYRDVFDALKVPVTIKINNRKLLEGLAEVAHSKELLKEITIAIDKLDKIGIDKVKEELSGKQLQADAVQTIETYLSISGSNKEKIAALRNLFATSRAGNEGLDELTGLLEGISGDRTALQIDTTLARGLDYYTGTIFEVKCNTVKMGSIGGGGRYDNLTGLFGVNNIPGVGISFGIDRIYDVMEELRVFPAEVENSLKVIFFNLGVKEADYSFSLVQKCRSERIPCELYYESAKLGKQFKYADKKGILFAVIIGSREMEEGLFQLKNLQSGEEHTYRVDEIVKVLAEKAI